MTTGEPFSMGELVRRTGVHPATVRHYLSLGLLPSPQRAAANRFLYDRRHEQALRVVRLLRERRKLSLTEIARMLPSLSKMPGDQAFHPEMWDQVMAARLPSRGRRDPAARLLRAGMAAFSRHGFAEVRVDDVCRSAKLAKGSFYRHYRSKEDLFFATAVAAGTEVGQAFAEALGSPRRSRAGQGGRAEVDADVTEAEAGLAMGRALAPHLPLMLDLLTQAAQRRPGHARVAESVFAELRRVVRSRLGQPGADRRVVGQALLLGIRQLIDDPDVGSPLLAATLGPDADMGRTLAT